MNIDKPCHNSFCEPAATERKSKKIHGFHRCNGVFDTDFFDLCSLIYIWIQNGFASVTACGCCDSDCRVICYYFAYIYHRTNSGKTYPYLSSDNICYKNKEKRQISLFPFCRIRKIIYLCPVIISKL